MFEKTLTDLIQGLRANKRNESEYISKSLEEIQNEVQMSDMYYKTAAVDKLNYLHMLGYDMNWANFNVVEVMASSKFSEKRTGYLAATQSFHQDTDVLMLTTNLIRKDLASTNDMEVSVALDGLAQIATAELAQDLFDDVLSVVSHSRAYIRKKALVCTYKIVLKYPEGLRAFFPVLKEKLDDSDPSVVSAAVSVVCELASTNPQNYLPLAPKLYHLLTTSNNNWMLIKIVKLFAALTPIEPRLAKKLHGPVSGLVSSTSAMSLLYECIHTSIVGDIISVPLPAKDAGGRDTDFAEMCAHKLYLFFNSPDHNIRYVGLVTLAELQKRRPDLVIDNYETVLACLDDPDLSIRLRAIQVISGMATPKNLQQIVKKLMSQLILSSTISLKNNTGTAASGTDEVESLVNGPTVPGSYSSGLSLIHAQGAISPAVKRSQAIVTGPNPADNPEYRLAAVETIIDACSRQSYENLTNFEWYIAVLTDLVYIAGVDVGKLLAERMIDATVRVRQVREFSVKMMRRLLSDKTLSVFTNDSSSAHNAHSLTAAAYILGEYCKLVPANHDDIFLTLPSTMNKLDGEQQAVFVQASMKVYTNWLVEVASYWNEEIWELVRSTTASVMSTLTSLFITHQIYSDILDDSMKLVDRAVASLPIQINSKLRRFIEILKTVSVATSNPTPNVPPICSELHALFTIYELNPVSAVAQGKVPIPDDLDLDSWIGDAIPDTTFKIVPPPPPPPPQPSSHNTENIRGKARAFGRDNEPFYLNDAADRPQHLASLPDVDDIPVVPLDISESKTKTRSKNDSERRRKKKGHKKHKKRTPSPSPPPKPKVDIVVDEDMPGEPGIEEIPTNTAASDEKPLQIQAATKPQYGKKDVLANNDLEALRNLNLNPTSPKQQ